MNRKCTLKKVRLNKQGYTHLGHYYGVGEPVFWCMSDDGTIDMTLRAADRAAAKQQIRDNLIPVGSDMTFSFYN